MMRFLLVIAAVTLAAPHVSEAAKRKAPQKSAKLKKPKKGKGDASEAVPTAAESPASAPVQSAAPSTPGAPPQTPSSPSAAPEQTIAAQVTPSPAPGEKKSIGFGVNAHGGLHASLDGLPLTFSVGGELRERFPFLKRSLALSASFDYFQPEQTRTATAASVGDFSYRASLRIFQVSADLLFFLPLGLPIDLYLGAGYSLFILQASVVAFDLTQTESQLAHGVRGRVGVQWPFFYPLYVALEAQYHWVDFTFDITGRTNFGSVLGTLLFGFEL